MATLSRAAALAAAGALCAPPAFAHAIAGARVFVPTLTMDDPGVADEMNVPTFQWQRSGAGGGPGPSNEYQFNLELDKRITETFGININYGANVITTAHAKTQAGFQNLFVTGKYQAYVNAEHEFIASLGLQREFGGTGKVAAGADQYGATSPILYMGKGLGDLSIGPLRALGVTGELIYTIPDVRPKTASFTDPVTGLTTSTQNNGSSNQWFGAFSLQYNMQYLKSQVRDYGLPEWANRLVPLVEVSWISPSTAPPTAPVQWLIAPGVVYVADKWTFGVEALIPGNKQTGTNVGVIAQFHVFLDDVFPNSIGKPIFP